jgi:hypothetical protein
MKKRVLAIVILIAINYLAIGQNEKIGYKLGYDSLVRIIDRNLSKKCDISKLDSNAHVIAFFEVVKGGTIEHITLTSMNDTTLSQCIYDLIMQTNGNWITGKETTCYFEIPFDFIHVGNDNILPRIPLVNVAYYENGAMTNFVKLKSILTVIYPSVR